MANGLDGRTYLPTLFAAHGAELFLWLFHQFGLLFSPSMLVTNGEREPRDARKIKYFYWEATNCHPKLTKVQAILAFRKKI